MSNSLYFISYKGGILSDEVACGSTVDNAINIVGYGTENGINFWIIRNSWGMFWGEFGYVRIKMTTTADGKGICGISSLVSYPLPQK